MEAIELVMEETLADMEKHIVSMQDGGVDAINKAYITLKKYEKDIRRCSEILTKITQVQELSKSIFRNILLNKKASIVNSTLPKRTTHSGKPGCESDVSSTHIKQQVLKKGGSFRVKHVNVTNDARYKQMQYCKIPVIEISEGDIDMCQQAPIYKIHETNEYVFKINCMVFRGNIGSIFSKKDCKKKVYKCTRPGCSGKFFDDECEFRHEHDVRNFTDYSWSHHKGGSTRHLDMDNTRMVGNLDTLSDDICRSDMRERDLRQFQLVHDLLIFSILKNYHS